MTEHLTRREQEKELFKEKVIQAALQLMTDDNDWGGVSVNEIAKIIKYTPPNIYHYFKNKEDIQYQIGRKGSEILYETYRVYLNDENLTAKEKLYRVGQSYWKFAFKHKQIYSLMFHTVQKKLDTKLIWRNVNVWIDLIREATTKGHSDDQIFELYQETFCLIHGFISIKMNNRIPIKNKTEFKKMFDRALKRHIDDI